MKAPSTVNPSSLVTSRETSAGGTVPAEKSETEPEELTAIARPG